MIPHLVSSTVVALAVILVARRDRPAWRHGLLLVAILRFAIPTNWLRVVVPAGVIESLSPMLLHPGPIDTISRAAVPPVAGFDWRIIWAAGTAMCLILWARRAFRRIPAVRPPAWEEMQMFPGVPLRIVAAGRVPGACGLFRQQVILPQGLDQHLSVAEMQAVVAHEMAHIRRFDNLTAAIAHAVVSVFWFHPLLWWLERRMFAERETACDEIVLGQGVAPQEYVSGIAKICRMSFAGAAGYAGVNGSNLHRRMEHIMNANLMPGSSRLLRAAAGAAIALVTLLPLAGGFARAQAPSHRETMVAVEGHTSAGRFDDAVALLQAEIAKNPAAWNLQLALGNVLVRAGRYDDALKVFVSTLEGIAEFSPQRADIYLRIGETYRRKGDIPAALAVLDKAKALAPENMTVLSTRALTLDAAGRRDEAKAAYREVIAHQENGIALNNLAYLISETGGDLDEALALAQRAKQVLPNTWEVGDTLGWIYLKRGNMSGAAVEVFADLVVKAPSRRAFRDHLVLALDQRGDTAAAVQELKELLRAKPSPENDQRMVELTRTLLR